jgi:hypothetical protein
MVLSIKGTNTTRICSVEGAETPPVGIVKLADETGSEAALLGKTEAPSL